MAYSVTKLITHAYYLSQVVSRNLQTVSGDQFSDGLDLLNALLEVKGSDVRLIPYFTRGEFLSTVDPSVGEQVFFIPNMVSIETLTFNLSNVQFSMTPVGRKDFFGGGRIEGIESLPFSYHAERVLGGMNIYPYFNTGQVLQMKYMAKFGLTDVTATTDLTTVYDLFYIEYLRYALAEYICSEWAVNFPEQAAKKYAEIRKKLMDVSPPDLKMQKMSTLRSGQVGLTFGQINLSPGWLPTS